LCGEIREEADLGADQAGSSAFRGGVLAFVGSGKQQGVTRERIRQIEAKALERIRFHERAKQLRSY
jgi:hypothetical protein